MAISQTTIEAVMRILSEWNPLNDRAAFLKDLDGYRTEATDVLVQLTMNGSERNAPKIVQTVLSQAFEVDLSLAECREPGFEIWRVHLQGKPRSS